ncbi:MAG: metal-sensitive transcriptional regulator [Thermotogae bacterium]|nr:metal-sensitive transcriptional regulator [Thermotogota bacterium]
MEKKALNNRLKRIEGQIRGLQKMIEDDRQCSEILTQLSAVSGALEKTGQEIMREYAKSCIVEYEENQDDTLINNLIDTLSRFRKI